MSELKRYHLTYGKNEFHTVEKAQSAEEALASAMRPGAVWSSSRPQRTKINVESLGAIKCCPHCGAESGDEQSFDGDDLRDLPDLPWPEDGEGGDADA